MSKKRPGADDQETLTGNELLNRLARISILSALTYPVLRRLSEQGRLIRASKDAVIIGPEFGSTGFFAILEGTVAVSIPFGPMLNYLGPGDIFGEMALLEGVERSAYCRAYTDCLLFEVPFEAFHSDMLPNPAIRDATDELSKQRRAVQVAIKKGGEPPELEPPEPEPEEVPEANVDAGTMPGDGQPATKKANEPPTVYVTA